MSNSPLFTVAAYIHPSDGVDLGTALTGANVISDVTVNTAGHVTGFSTRALTPANIGAATTAQGALADSALQSFTETSHADVLVDADIGVNVQAYSATNALTGDITYGQLDTNGDVGTGSSQLAAGNHNHSGVYEPADGTILKDADIGVNVQAYSATTAKISDITYGQLNTNGDVGTGSSQLAIGNHTHTFASLTSKPTTLSGFGITDAATTAQGALADSALQAAHDVAANHIDWSTDQGGTLIDPANYVADSSSWDINGNHIYANNTANVGIGTNDPSGKLEIRETIPNTVSKNLALTNQGTGAGNGASLLFKNSSGNQPITGALEALDDGLYGYHLAFSNKPTGVDTNPITERMRIDSAGNVGIGNTAPANRLHVSSGTPTGAARSSTMRIDSPSGVTELYIASSDTGGGQLRFGDVSSSFRGALLYDHSMDYMSFTTSGSERIRITATGRVCMGRTAPIATETLSVLSGAIAATFYRITTFAIGTICEYYSNVGGTQTKVAELRADGTLVTISDVTLKENIKDSTLGLAEVLAIPVRSFDWAGSSDHVDAGFIAQELALAIPQAAPVGEGGLMMRSDAHLIPVLVKAIQEQQAIIDNLTTRLEALENT